MARMGLSVRHARSIFYDADMRIVGMKDRVRIEDQE
jgi:hypothetical protein